MFLRRQTAREPKKVPAAVNTQIVMVTAVSLVVIIFPLLVKLKISVLTVAQNDTLYFDADQVLDVSKPLATKGEPIERLP